MRETTICPFTATTCTGGIIYDDGWIGCVFKDAPESECSWLAEVPDGQTPRDFYIEKVMEASL